MNLQSSTLKADETGEPFHVQQAKQIRLYRGAWRDAGHGREPRVSVSRSIFPLVDDRDRAYFGRSGDSDQIGVIDNMRAVFGRSYAAEPERLVEQLRADEAIAEADTLLLTVPNQLGVEYNAHVIESVLKHVAPVALRHDSTQGECARQRRAASAPGRLRHCPVCPRCRPRDGSPWSSGTRAPRAFRPRRRRTRAPDPPP